MKAVSAGRDMRDVCYLRSEVTARYSSDLSNISGLRWVAWGGGGLGLEWRQDCRPLKDGAGRPYSLPQLGIAKKSQRLELTIAKHPLLPCKHRDHSDRKYIAIHPS